MKNRLFVLLQFLIPQHALSRLVYRLTRIRWPWFKDSLIRGFVWLYKVDISDAAMQVPEDYVTFNAFFTRALRKGARPLPAHPLAMISPVDGTISQAGDIRDGRMLQAKGFRYSVADLLGDIEEAWAFNGGNFATIYLAPYNYHRIHMPLAGGLERMRYVPGRLFSVNQATVAALPRLFARNERLVCHFSTPAGPTAMVLVGAMNVGSMSTVWDGEITPCDEGSGWQRSYRRGRVALARGAEMGRFNMGSTVILLTGPQRVTLDARLTAGRTLRMGQTIGALNGPIQPSDST
jgi:phosphatidylserine decarboxylase